MKGGLIMNKTNNENKKACEYDVKVVRAKEFDGGSVSFDLVVNGINIYGLWYREYTNKKGEEGNLISFPSRKGNDDKYYNHCWFPIDNDIKADIIDQLVKLV